MLVVIVLILAVLSEGQGSQPCNSGLANDVCGVSDETSMLQPRRSVQSSKIATAETEHQAESALFLAKVEEVRRNKTLLDEFRRKVELDPPSDEVGAFLKAFSFVQAQMSKESAVSSKIERARGEVAKAQELGNSSWCSQTTGGTCGFFGCSAWRHAKCISSRSWFGMTKECKCESDQCAVDGMCVNNDPKYLCSKDTGGTCRGGGCYDWRSASCQDGKCLCQPGECAVEGRCVPSTPAPTKAAKTVAVIGCGVAGALTALELAHVGKQVTIIDREASCGVGTSGRIAAEMMFYSYHKAFWKGGWADVEGALLAVKNMQTFGNFEGGIAGMQYVAAKESLSGASRKIELQSYKPGGLTFQCGRVSPVVTQAEPPHPRHLVGMRLEAISGLPAYEIVALSKLSDCDDKLQTYLANAPKPITLKLVEREDPRTNEVYEAAFFEAAGERLRDFYLVEFPELCEAVITPLCCVPGTAARRWVENNPSKAGYTCPADPFAQSTGSDPGMGVVHSFATQTVVDNMNSREKQSNLYDFEVWNEAETDTRIAEWLMGDRAYGAAVNRRDSGFVRTELLFPVIMRILEARGSSFDFGREIVAVEPQGRFVSVRTKAVGGQWKDEQGIRTFVPTDSPEGATRDASYDRVVFATGAAVGSALDRFDPAINKRNQLLPVNGYIVLGPKEHMSQRATGVVFEEYHMYLRSSRDGSAAIGGGMFFTDGTDQQCRTLRWMEGWQQGSYFDANNYMSQAAIGEKLVKDPATIKMGGVRPMSVFGNFPLIKSYFGGRVVLNTGGGANGFVVSWLSAKITADLAINGQPSDARWHDAFTEI